MTYEQYSPEWLIEHCDNEIAFERAVSRQMSRLLAENDDFRATIDHLTRENAGQIGEIVALKEQRDELLEALRRIADTSANQSGTGAPWVHWVDQARAAAPQPPVVEQPQPLTIEQIARIDSATEWPEGSLRNIGPRDWRRLLVAATRAIERAHGIGGEA